MQGTNGKPAAALRPAAATAPPPRMAGQASQEKQARTGWRDKLIVRAVAVVRNLGWRRQHGLNMGP
jgi:hypothetical protein